MNNRVIKNQGKKREETKQSKEGFIEYIAGAGGVGLIIAFAILILSEETSNFIINSFKTYWWIFHYLITGGVFILSDGDLRQKSLRGLKVWIGLLLAFFIVSTVIATK